MTMGGLVPSLRLDSFLAPAGCQVPESIRQSSVIRELKVEPLDLQTRHSTTSHFNSIFKFPTFNLQI